MDNEELKAERIQAKAKAKILVQQIIDTKLSNEDIQYYNEVLLEIDNL